MAIKLEAAAPQGAVKFKKKAVRYSSIKKYINEPLKKLNKPVTREHKPVVQANQSRSSTSVMLRQKIFGFLCNNGPYLLFERK